MSQMRKRNQLSPDANRDNKRIRYTEDGTVVTTLLLSPLGKEVTAAQLYDHFSTFGPVDNVRITSLGYATFAYVKFTYAESAAQALDMKRHSFAGHVTSVVVAASQEESIKDDLPVELTNVTGTCLVNLNEDCLLEMFSSKYLRLMDLCSVAETCSCLKGVAMEIFRREYGTAWHFYRNSAITIDDARKIFFNFGSVISELKIDWTGSLNERTNQIMDSVTTYCSTLRTLSMDGFDCSKLFPVIAKNCSQLEELDIRAERTSMSRVHYERALECLLVLGQLKVLKIHFGVQTVTQFTRQLYRLKSLEFLELIGARNVSKFISELSQLKKLKVLRFIRSYGLQNLNLLGNLDRLTELRVDFDFHGSVPDWNVGGMVERLIHLETLEIYIYGFQMDRKSYNGIVRAVQGRPDPAKRTLALKCGRNFSLDNDDDNHRRVVKFLKF